MCVGTLTFRKLFSAFFLTSLMTLNLTASAADEVDLVVNIAPGKNYLALSSDELYRASKSATPEASRNVLQDLANQRAY